MIDVFGLTHGGVLKTYVAATRFHNEDGEFWAVTASLGGFEASESARDVGMATGLALRKLGEVILADRKVVIAEAAKEKPS